MKLKVSEILEMVKNHKLYTDISTQRKFVYNNMETNVVNYTHMDNAELLKMSKSGKVIKAIMEWHMQLPALFFWSVQDDEYNVHYADDSFNLHDGLQRVKSLYYFRYPEDENRVSYIDDEGKPVTYKNLTREEQDWFNNYTFEVVVGRGTFRQEEISFAEINGNAVPLTAYESIHGCFHGKFLDGFEDFINTIRKESAHKKIQEIGRGAQAQYILYSCITYTSNSGLTQRVIENDKHKMYLITMKEMHKFRDKPFNPDTYHLREIIDLYCKLIETGSILTNNVNKDPEKVWQIANYVVSHKFDPDKVVEYYHIGKTVNNDIGSWPMSQHKIAIRALNGWKYDYMSKTFIQCAPFKCDYRRFYTEDDKRILYYDKGCRNCTLCASREYLDFKDAQVDHKIPWSSGGETNIYTNAQICCAQSNSKKGARFVED